MAAFGAQALGTVLNLSEHWYVCNKYSAASACRSCEGIVRCEPWCMRTNTRTRYAFSLILNTQLMQEGDRLQLHALGARY